VGVFGASGRMGAMVCAGLAAAEDLQLVAAVDPAHAGQPLAGEAATPLVVAAEATAMSDAGVEVAVDFTRAGAAMSNLRWCAAQGVHAVSGTSGLGGHDLDELRELFGAVGAVGSVQRAAGAGAGSATANCAWVPNFAIGAVLMMHLAEIAARHMDGAEIIELHHDGKVDAPSGTAAETARRLVRGRADAGGGPWAPDRTETFNIAGARGADAGGVHIHSVRLPGLVAHQEVLFGAPGQTLSIRHDSNDRTSFLPGVLLAVRGVTGRPGLTIGLDSFLGLSAP
jgi:4-hydroxy-tetrahydrodipicolinate reductase